MVPTVVILVEPVVEEVRYPESLVHWEMAPVLFVNAIALEAVAYVAEISGMSAATRALKVGTSADPVVGPAKMVFADSFERVTAIVPDEVTGELATLNPVGIVNPTDVTVPAELEEAKTTPLK
jgi:hypothetical protein